MTTNNRTGDEPAEGAIVRIKLENFMTYNSVELRPGAHLNVIAAPNGCGKSTLVNGICLGLAGKTKWLGRASHPTEFIKHGCDKATTEIELYNKDGDNKVIRREIHRSGSSSWTVNGRPGTHKVVEDIMTTLNIQVGNLCQFLPQDKVADFAKMSSIELLENTEKAVGSTKLMEYHQTLKESRGKAREIEASFKTLSDRLETEKAKNARLEQDVKNYEERQRHLEQVALLEKKRAWLAYEEKRKLFISEKEKKKEVQTRLVKKKRENAPLEQKVKQAQSVIKQDEGKMQRVTEVLRKDAEEAASKNMKIDNLTEKMAEVRDEIDGKREDELRRQKKVNELKKQVSSIQNELANLDTTQDVQPEIDAVNREKHKITQERTKHNQSMEATRMDLNGVQRELDNANNQLQRLNDIGNQKLNLLRQKHKQTYEAVIWLRQNKGRFKGTIHEPLMMQLHVRDQRFAKYVENHISFNDMKAFIFEESEDVHNFMAEVRDKQRLPVNGAKVPPGKSLADFKPKYPIQQLARYGFHSYLKDLVEAPEPIMIYLCTQYRIHEIPVGDKRTKDMVDTIQRERPDITSFYSENDRHSINRSRYTGNTITTRMELRQPNLLTVSVDQTYLGELTRTVRRCEETINTKRDEQRNLQNLIQQCDVKINDCNNRKKDLQKKRDQRSSFEQQINMKNQSIKRLEEQARDIQAEENRAMRKIQEINLKKCGLLNEMMDLTRKCAEHSMGKVKFSLSYTMALHSASALENQFQDQLTEIQTLETELKEVSESADRMKDEARRLFMEAKKATGTGSGDELASEYKDPFSRLPDNLEEIDNMIHSERARADCKFQTDENVMHEFNDRKREIAKMEREYEKTKDRLENYETEIANVKREWIEPLKALIARINKNFSFYFKALKCAGEVDLEVPDNEEDYERYGIQIKVKFRDNESLRVLSPHAQSGGEKSVSTVLYMMALQELTQCPFRVVDEINQGMDAFNERKVYEMVLTTACHRNTSQYFLLTPKLLPDLEYSENMTVLCINNGPFLMSHTDWNVRKFLKRRSRLED